MNIKKQIFKGTIWGIIANIIIVVFSFITVILLARWLGPKEYGFLPLALSIATLLGSFAVGIGQSTARFIAEYRARDISYIRSILKDGIFFIIIFGTLTSSLLVMFSQKIALFLGEPRLEIFLKIGAIYLFATYIVIYTYYVFEGFQRIDLNALRVLIESLSKIILAFGFVLLGYGAVGAYLGYVLSSIISAVIGLTILYLKFYKTAIHSIKSIKKSIFKYSIPLININAVDLIYKHIDTIMIGYFLGTNGVAFYTIPKKIIESLGIPAFSMGAAVAPAIAYGRGNNTDSINSKLFYETIKYLIILFLPIAVGLAILSQPIIILFFGKEFINSIELLRLSSLLLLLFTIGSISSSILIYTGKAGIRAKIFGIAGLMNLMLNIVFIPTFGAKGAIYATIITYIPYLLLSFRICLNEFRLSLSIFNPLIFKVLISSLLMGSVIIILFGSINTFLGLILAVFIGGIVYLILIFMLRLITIRDLSNMINRYLHN